MEGTYRQCPSRSLPLAMGRYKITHNSKTASLRKVSFMAFKST